MLCNECIVRCQFLKRYISLYITKDRLVRDLNLRYSIYCKQKYFLGENIMKHINENGRSMVEMLGVLAIIGVLSVGGIAGYSKAMNKYKINKTTDQVSMLVANIRTLFSSQGNYEGISNASAIKFGVVPNEMYDSSDSTGSTMKNAFNGAVTITSDAARSGQTGVKDAFIIEYNGLSEEACITIATGDWGSGQSSGLIGIAAGVATDGSAGTLSTIGKKLNSIYVDAGTVTSGGGVAVPGNATVPTPMSVTEAVKACGTSTSSGANHSVAWKYY